MHKEVYNSFKLLGYKINELPNGYFIAQRPDKTESILNAKGKVIRSNLSNIERMSDVLYLGNDIERNKAILFDSNSNIIDSTDKKSIYPDGNFIIVKHKDRNETIIYDRKINTKFIFKGNDRHMIEEASIIRIVHVQGKYNIIFIDPDNCLKMVDTNMKVVEIRDAVTYNYRQINNNYITKYIGTLDDGEMEVIDYKGNTVCQGQSVYIDTWNMDSDVIVVCTNKVIVVTSKKLKLKKVMDMDEPIHSIRFTKNPYVLAVSTSGKTYMLNVCTSKRTQDYNRLCDNIGISKDGNGYVIDLETLQDELRFTDLYSIARLDEEIIVRYHGRNEHYTMDLKPLIHEFD